MLLLRLADFRASLSNDGRVDLNISRGILADFRMISLSNDGRADRTTSRGVLADFRVISLSFEFRTDLVDFLNSDLLILFGVSRLTSEGFASGTRKAANDCDGCKSAIFSTIRFPFFFSYLLLDESHRQTDCGRGREGSERPAGKTQVLARLVGTKAVLHEPRLARTGGGPCTETGFSRLHVCSTNCIFLQLFFELVWCCCFD